MVQLQLLGMLDLVAELAAGLVVNHDSVGLVYHHHGVQLQTKPCALPCGSLPVGVHAPLAFQADQPISVQSTHQVQLDTEVFLGLGRKCIMLAPDIAFAVVMHARTAFIRMFCLAGRERALGFWDTLIMFQPEHTLAFVEVSELRMRPRIYHVMPDLI